MIDIKCKYCNKTILHITFCSMYSDVCKKCFNKLFDKKGNKLFGDKDGRN